MKVADMELPSTTTETQPPTPRASNGGASFTIDEKKYTIVQNMMAWAETQDVLERRGRRLEAPDAIGRQVDRGSLVHLGAMFYGMLQQHHSSEIQTLQQALALMELAPEAINVAMRIALGLVSPAGDATSAVAQPPAVALSARGARRRSASR